ncbi:MAG: DUF1444 family protein [Planctomycetes bacterium]|nr:DUF1444 family protein [Planctomycetota bacterium]
MWFGLVVLWGTFAVCVVLRRRRTLDSFVRRAMPQRTERFLTDLQDAFEKLDGASLSGVVPGRFLGVVKVDGQETPIPLQPLEDHWRMFPFDLPDVVERIVDEIRADGLDSATDFEFVDLAMDLMPQVRRLDWVRANSPAFGDGRLVHRPLGSDLALCYVIDDSWSMVFVCEGHLRRWRKTERQVHGLAVRNLRERTDDDVRERLGRGEPVSLRTSDGYAASRVLLVEHEEAGDLLFALPDRDVLWVGDSAGADIADLMGRSADECAASAHPLSPKLYRISGGAISEAGR